MDKDLLHFVVSNDTVTDYLILEAYIDNKLLADLYNENGAWQVDFLLENGKWSISWELFTQIHQKFAEFVEEMKSYPTVLSEEK
jgi:hypothetical protein